MGRNSRANKINRLKKIAEVKRRQEEGITKPPHVVKKRNFNAKFRDLGISGTAYLKRIKSPSKQTTNA